jgi:ABC-2 type transport system permease protein
MRQLFHIVYYKLISGIKLKFEPKLNTMMKNAASLIVFGGFAAGAFFFSYNVTAYLIEDIRIGQFLLHRFLSMFLFVFFITISLGNILVSYSTLFKSPEVRFLFTTPVSHFKVFLVKFLDNFFYSSTTFFLMGFAVIAGYGAYFSQPWYFYPFALIFVFFPFMLFAAAIAVIVLLAVIRLTEYVQLKHLAALFVVGYLAAVYIFFHSVSPISLVNNVLQEYPDIDRYFTGFDPWFLKFLPNHWVAELMYWSAQGNLSNVLFHTGQLLVSAGIVLTAALATGRRLYYRSWLLSMAIRNARPPWKKPGISKVFDLAAPSMLPRSMSVILKRDFIRFLRDPGQWVHFVLIVLLVTVFLFSIRSLDVELYDPFLLTVIYLVLFLFNAFLVSAIGLRFVYPMVSLEGEALWAIRSAPFRMRRLYILKGATAASVLAAIAVLLAYVTVDSMHNDVSLVAFTMGGQLLTVGTVVGLNLGLGSYFAHYTEKNPIRIASSQGASLTFLIVILYLFIIVSIYMPFMIRYFEQSLLLMSPGFAWMAAPLLLNGTLSLLLAGTASVLGIRAIRRDV